MSSDFSCPYCNSPAAVPVGAHPGQRIPCPRCGESFPYRAAIDGDLPVAPSPSPPPIPPFPTPHRFSNTGIALVILSVMIVMALLGLFYALKTESIRRAYDLHLPKTKAISIPIDVVFPLGLYILVLIFAWFRGWNRREGTSAIPRRRFAGLLMLSAAVLLLVEFAIIVIHARAVRPFEDEQPPVAPVQPKELLALGYLPADTDVIFALHAGELLSEPIGRDLIDHLGSDDLNARSFEGWSGLKLAEMDHAVLGLTLDANLLRNFTIVIRARRPIDRGRVLNTLKAKDAREVAGRSVQEVTIDTGIPNFRKGGANLWFADDQTLVVAGTFEAGPDHRVPMTPESGLKNLRPELRELIEQRFGPSAQFWIAGQIPPENSRFILLNGLLALPDNAPLSQVKRFGLWVTLYPTEMALRGSFECTGEEAAKALQAYLAPSNRRGLKAWLAPPEAGPLEKALNESMTRTQHESWVELQAKASADAIRQSK
jgi:hypothetical protein